jgi:hypothetical protein
MTIAVVVALAWNVARPFVHAFQHMIGCAETGAICAGQYDGRGVCFSAVGHAGFAPRLQGRNPWPHEELMTHTPRRTVMHKDPRTDFGFPGIAFATLPTTGETIAIRYGERIYYPVGTSKTADELNAMYGVTPAQARAILASVLAGWEAQGVEPESHAA